MASGFHDGSRSLQDRFDTRALADRIDGLLVSDTIGERDREFIEARDMFFLATADAEGRPTCSYKGGEPGFVRVLDEHTLVFPELRRQRHVPLHRQRAGEPGRGACCSSTSSAATGCGWRARRASTSKTRCEATTRRHSSSSGSARERCTRTVRATSTATSS